MKNAKPTPPTPLGQEIKEKLSRLDWTQAKLVREIKRLTGANIHYPTINNIINGKTADPHGATLDVITRTLDRAIKNLESDALSNTDASGPIPVAN